MGLGVWLRGWKKHQKGAIVALKDERYNQIVLKNGSTKEFQTYDYFIKEAEEFVDKYFYN